MSPGRLLIYDGDSAKASGPGSVEVLPLGSLEFPPRHTGEQLRIGAAGEAGQEGQRRGSGRCGGRLSSADSSFHRGASPPCCSWAW